MFTYGILERNVPVYSAGVNSVRAAEAQIHRQNFMTCCNIG